MIDVIDRRVRQIAGVLLFLFYRVRFFRRFSSVGLSVFRLNSVLKIGSKGRVDFAGKASLAPYSQLSSKGHICIGSNFTLNEFSRVVCLDEIIIGDNVMIAQFVSILDHDHAYAVSKDDSESKIIFDGYSTKPIIIGSNVWIGTTATILKGVTVGSNVIIGANAVVTRDVPNMCIVAGSPERVVKKL